MIYIIENTRNTSLSSFINFQVSLVDKQVGVRAPGGDAESAEKRGLLWLLDEEAIYPGATDQSFVERLLLQVNLTSSINEKYQVFFEMFSHPKNQPNEKSTNECT